MVDRRGIEPLTVTTRLVDKRDGVYSAASGRRSN